jgi:hypothetical protein
MTGEYERVLEKSQWSKVVYSSCRPVGCPGADGMQFFTSDGQIRPRNQAIRIWKRIK